MKKGLVICLLVLFLIACSSLTGEETAAPTATTAATSTHTPTSTAEPSPTATATPSATPPPPTDTLMPTVTLREPGASTGTPAAGETPSSTSQPTSGECVVRAPEGDVGRWVAPGTPFRELGLTVYGDCRIFYRRAAADPWQELGSTAGYPPVSSEEFGYVPLDLEGEYEIRNARGERLWGFGVAKP